MERFYVPKEYIANGQAVINGDEYKHMSRVLRLRVGDNCEIYDGEGNGWFCEIASMDAQAVVNLLSKINDARESDLKTYLLQGLPKGEKMEFIIQKCTELGITGIVPVAMERSIVKIEKGDKEDKKLVRWNLIAENACSQCGRLRFPDIRRTATLTGALTMIEEGDLLLVPWEEGGVSLNYVLSGLALDKKRKILRGESKIFYLVGPEGGITREEIKMCRDKGAIIITLGPRILRTETAAIMVETMLQFALGDLAEAPSGHFDEDDLD